MIKMMNTAEVLDCAVDVYKRSFWKQIAFSAVISVISFFGAGFLAILVVVGVAVVATVGVINPDGAGFVAVVFAGVVVFTLLWQWLISIGHIIMAKSTFFGEGRSFLVENFVKAIPRVVSVLVAQALVLLPYVIVCFYVVWEMALFLDRAGFYAASSVVLFGVLIFVVALIFLFGFFVLVHMMGLAVAVSVFEKRLFFGAIGRALQLISGRFWLIFAARVVWGLITFVVGYSVMAIVFFAIFVVTYLGDSSSVVFVVASGLITVLMYLMLMVTSLVAMPMEGIFNAIIYFNQRIKNEGLDIELELERLKS
ncbi:MAG: hypothetical protein FWC78_05260 [Defluviitaleaceae bacterium]|nr:hypothetical protein [Defluviitaleaceae bacterium]